MAAALLRIPPGRGSADPPARAEKDGTKADATDSDVDPAYAAIAAKRYCVYVLECLDRMRGGRRAFYIGRVAAGPSKEATDAAVSRRFEAHITGKGAEFTRTHPPVRIVARIYDANYLTETTTFLDYTIRYPRLLVRGGPYPATRIGPVQQSSVSTIIDSATDKCNLCGGVGHFQDECKATFARPTRASVARRGRGARVLPALVIGSQARERSRTRSSKRGRGAARATP